MDSEPNSTAKCSPGRVLIVAENSDGLEHLSQQIYAAGYDLRICDRLEQELPASADSDPDLVLLQPGFYGLALEELLNRTRLSFGGIQVPLVLIPAEGASVDRAVAYGNGVADIIESPFIAEEVVHKIVFLTRLRQVSVTLESTAKELVHASIMRDKLSRMIIHDLRSPLTSLALTLESVSRPEELLDMPAETLELAKMQVRMGAELCDQLLFVGRVEKNGMLPASYPASLKSTIASAVAILSPQSNVRNLTVTIDVPDLEVDIDHRLTGRIVLNLVSNAIKASSDGGKIEINGSTDNGNLIIRVSDNGYGIPRQLQESIFDLYAQSGDYFASEGSGIGLAFCKVAATAMGGTISLESESDKGSLFILQIPHLRKNTQ